MACAEEDNPLIHLIKTPQGRSLYKLAKLFEERTLNWMGIKVISVTFRGYGDGTVAAILELEDSKGTKPQVHVELIPEFEEEVYYDKTFKLPSEVRAFAMQFLKPDTEVFATKSSYQFAQFVFRIEGDLFVFAISIDYNKKGRKIVKREMDRQAQRHIQQEERQRQKEAKQAALELEAISRGFADVTSMFAADAKAAVEQAEAELLRKQAAEEERQRARREADKTEAAKNAEEACHRKKEMDALAKAAHFAKFGKKKGSPPLSSDSSRSASASPPLPSGGQAGRR
jgi:hypothetical protein